MLVLRFEGEARGHMRHEPMFNPPAAYKYRSHHFCVPMPWEDIYSKLQEHYAEARGTMLPRGREEVGTMVHLRVVGVSMDLMRYVCEFCVRQKVVLDLCERLIAKGHLDVRVLS